MKSLNTQYPYTSEGIAPTGADNPTEIPSQFPIPRSSTGTVDDDDEPEDEHGSENEASQRETHDDTEAPEEFKIDDED
jgi:hypothetical protein